MSLPESFDPLASVGAEEIAELALKQRVRDIIASYHRSTDVLAELVQNAVDKGGIIGLIHRVKACCWFPWTSPTDEMEEGEGRWTVE